MPRSVVPKMKLFLSRINVIEVISEQIKTKTIKRFKNLILKFLEWLASLKDIPEITIKLVYAFTQSNGNPRIMFSNSIN